MDSKQRNLPKEEAVSSSADELSRSASRVALADSGDEGVGVLVRRAARSKPHNPFVAKAKESLHRAFKKAPKPKLITPESRRESSASGTSSSASSEPRQGRPANSDPSAASQAPLPAQTVEPVLLVERSQASVSQSSESGKTSGSKATPAPSPVEQQVVQRKNAPASGEASPSTAGKGKARTQNQGSDYGEQQIFKRRGGSGRRSSEKKGSQKRRASTSSEQQVFKRRQGTVQGKRKRKQYPRAEAQQSELGLSWWYSIWSRSAWIGRVLWVGAFGCAWVALSRCMDPGVSDPELSQVPYYALLGWFFCAGLALNRHIPSRFRWTALALGLANSAALALAWSFRLDQL